MDTSPLTTCQSQAMTLTPQDPVEVDQPETSSQVQARQDWLQAQIDSYKAEILSAKPDPLPEDQQAAENIDIMSELEEKLGEAYIQKHKKELLIRRVQMGQFLVRELFEKSMSETTDRAEKEKLAVRAKYLKELLDKQSGLVTGILTKLKEMEPKRKKLLELKKKNFEKMSENRRLIQEISERENSPRADDTRDQETKDLFEDLDKILQKIAIARNTLQALIIGSGVNWAQDPTTQDLVLEMGKKLEL